MTHEGGCHCGQVRFRAEGDFGEANECNCSHCQAKGLLLAFVPASAFTLVAGEDALATYRFNRHVIEHRFCRTCGVQPFAQGRRPDGQATVAVNVRALDGIDLLTVARKPIDGRSF